MATTALNAPPRRPRKPRRLKRPIRRRPTTMLGFLALGAAVAIVALVLAAGVYILDDAYSVGHQATPTEAVDGFLDAALHERDIGATRKYTCDHGNADRKIASIVRRINKYTQSNSDVFITYRWDLNKKQESNGAAVVVSHVEARTTVGSQATNNPPQRWKFWLRDESGWKICRMSTPN